MGHDRFTAKIRVERMSGARYDAGVTIPELIERAAALDGDGVALAAPARAPLTYADLRQQIAGTVAALRGAGVRSQHRVAVILPNGPEMATAVLGTACAAASAPLNPGYSESEFRFYLSDLGATALIVPAGYDGTALAVAEALGIRPIEACWESAWRAGRFELLGVEAARGIGEPGPRPDATALVLHTSGTTSRPKMVPLSHRNLCVSARNVAITLELSASDRCLNVMPLFHIHGIVAALLASMMAGASVGCMPGYRNGEFLGCLSALQPTWYTAVPTVHQAILAELAGNPAGAAGHRLRFARSSSSALPPVLMRELEQALGVPVVEAYGMTEAAHQIAANPLPPGQRRAGSVGLAAGPEVGIMDSEGRLRAAGEIAEIVIRGDNVTAGYEANPEANAAAFRSGWFRTGDQGYLDADGYLYITGRIKEIINRGGEKVPPAEVDAALLEHPAVAQAVAFGTPHATLGEDVAAVVVLKDGARATETEIRDSLFGRLTEFKIPSRVVIVDAIPKGSTGKIQRIGLGDKLAGSLKRRWVAPRDDTEAAVAEMFERVLGVERVGALDNFFALGGDSLRGFQVLARVRLVLHVDLPIPALFKHPTVAELAVEIARIRANTELSALERVLAEVERLTDDEAAELLARERDGPRA